MCSCQEFLISPVQEHLCMYLPTCWVNLVTSLHIFCRSIFTYIHSILCSEHGFVVRPVLSAAYCESSKFRRFLTLASVPILRETSQKALIAQV
jgi:hypothetical protein